MRPDIEVEAEPRPRPDADARSGRPSGHRRRLTVAGVTAFQAVVEERLRNLEAEVAEVKGRVNGLIFLIAGTVAAQVLLRLFQ